MEALDKIIQDCPEIAKPEFSIIKRPSQKSNLLDSSAYPSDEPSKLKRNLQGYNSSDVSNINDNTNSYFVIMAEKDTSKVCCTPDKVLDNCSIF